MITTTAAAAPYSFSAAISLAISGVSVVLIALAMLAVLVILMGKIVGSLEKKPEAAKAAPVVAAPKSDVKAIPAGMTTLSESQSKGDINLFEVDDQTAALIMAIVADATETPLNQLYFRSIREVK